MNTRSSLAPEHKELAPKVTTKVRGQTGSKQHRQPCCDFKYRCLRIDGTYFARCSQCPGDGYALKQLNCAYKQHLYALVKHEGGTVNDHCIVGPHTTLDGRRYFGECAPTCPGGDACFGVVAGGVHWPGEAKQRASRAELKAALVTKIKSSPAASISKAIVVQAEAAAPLTPEVATQMEAGFRPHQNVEYLLLKPLVVRSLLEKAAAAAEGTTSITDLSGTISMISSPAVGLKSRGVTTPRPTCQWASSSVVIVNFEKQEGELSPVPADPTYLMDTTKTVLTWSGQRSTPVSGVPGLNVRYYTPMKTDSAYSETHNMTQYQLVGTNFFLMIVSGKRGNNTGKKRARTSRTHMMNKVIEGKRAFAHIGAQVTDNPAVTQALTGIASHIAVLEHEFDVTMTASAEIEAPASPGPPGTMLEDGSPSLVSADSQDTAAAMLELSLGWL